MKKRSAKTIKDSLWKYFSKYIRSKDADFSGYVSCITCGCTQLWQEMHCGHFLRNSERNQQLGGNALWYDERNFGPQCLKCNNYGGGEQAKFTIRQEAKYGFGILQELEGLRLTPYMWTREELEEKEKYYKSKIL